MKRSSRAAALLTALFVIPLHTACAEEEMDIMCSTAGSAQEMEIHLEAVDIPSQRLKASLEQGHAAEIRFHVRLYTLRGGLLSFLGDSLEKEFSLAYTGMWNPVIEGYTLVGKGERIIFADFSAFVEAFGSSTVVPSLSKALSSQNYIRAKVSIIPKVPVPPFTLLSPFLPRLMISSPWRRVEVES